MVEHEVIGLSRAHATVFLMEAAHQSLSGGDSGTRKKSPGDLNSIASWPSTTAHLNSQECTGLARKTPI